jgi:hypothetical protein
VFGWGENLSSQLGGTTPLYILSPTLITMPNLSANENISKIYAGVLNSFVLTTTGRVFALGNNSTGQFGNGSSSLNPISQVQTLAFQPTFASNERITDIAPAIDHTIYLTSLNKVYATGANIQGQLGIGNADPLSNRLNLISFSQLTSTEFISKIYANSQYSAAVSNQGKVFTWGNNEFSKLGDNTSVNKNTPTRINFLGLTSGERVTELNLSPNSAYAITSLGKFYSWGQNNVGQLGSGNFINRLFPQLVTLTLIKGSPIQMASAYQALANDGVRLNPILVAGCRDENGEMTSIPRSTATQVVSAQTARDVVLMLEKVVEDGAIGRATAVPGYRSAGKTGTAEIPEGAGYGDFFATSFFGMAPVEDPKYVMGVMVYKPRAVYTNSMAAAVGYQQILSQILISNRVPPSTTSSPEIPSNW